MTSLLQTYFFELTFMPLKYKRGVLWKEDKCEQIVSRTLLVYIRTEVEPASPRLLAPIPTTDSSDRATPNLIPFVPVEAAVE